MPYQGSGGGGQGLDLEKIPLSLILQATILGIMAERL